METFNYVAYLIVLIALFGAVVVWAFGRKRKKRFEEDAKMPFREQDPRKQGADDQMF